MNGQGGKPSPEVLEAAMRVDERRSGLKGCFLIALVTVALIGALEMALFLLSLAWHAGKAVFS